TRAEITINDDDRRSLLAAQLAVNKAHQSVTLLPDGTVLAVGYDEPSVERYDPLRNRWHSVELPSGWKFSSPAVRLMSGEVMLVGSSDTRSLAALFDPVSETWREILPPQGLNGTATLLDDGDVLGIGG